MAVTNTPRKDTSSPVIIDLGKQKRKRVKRLRQGKGRLMDEVHASVNELKATGSLAESAQPVIVLVRQKNKGWRKRMPRLF